MHEDDNSNCLCIITDVNMNIFKGLPNNKQLKIAEVQSVESTGELGIIDGQPFSASERLASLLTGKK